MISFEQGHRDSKITMAYIDGSNNLPLRQTKTVAVEIIGRRMVLEFSPMAQDKHLHYLDTKRHFWLMPYNLWNIFSVPLEAIIRWNINTYLFTRQYFHRSLQCILTVVETKILVSCVFIYHLDQRKFRTCKF